MRTVEYRDEAVHLIDQTRLPHDLTVITCRTMAEVAHAIKVMQVRGAPAIGVAAAGGLALAAHEIEAPDGAAFLARLRAAAEVLNATRPTAVNLAWALARQLRVAEAHAPRGVAGIRAALAAEAVAIGDEDVALNRRMGAHGAALLPDAGGVLTHCNAGALATADYGTALGVIWAAVERGKRLHVYADETRPRLQGARLTAWELVQRQVPATLIADTMAGHFMRQGAIQAVVVGADRIAANGDVANKIGTYQVAVLAREHGIPFYVAAPLSTIDPAVSGGEQIPIEERGEEEVTMIGGERIAPVGIRVANPAFDVTPNRYVGAIITEVGVLRAPFAASIAAALAAAAAPTALTGRR
jgi:methylthioribose-1-phosphate isomerase